MRCQTIKPPLIPKQPKSPQPQSSLGLRTKTKYHIAANTITKSKSYWIGWFVKICGVRAIELKIKDHDGAIVLASQVAFMRNEMALVELGSLWSLLGQWAFDLNKDTRIAQDCVGGVWLGFWFSWQLSKLRAKSIKTKFVESFFF